MLLPAPQKEVPLLQDAPALKASELEVKSQARGPQIRAPGAQVPAWGGRPPRGSCSYGSCELRPLPKGARIQVTHREPDDIPGALRAPPPAGNKPEGPQRLGTRFIPI